MRSMIWIRTEVKILIWIRIKVKSRIRIRSKVVRLSNPALTTYGISFLPAFYTVQPWLSMYLFGVLLLAAIRKVYF
jgi:hypothetical protein